MVAAALGSMKTAAVMLAGLTTVAIVALHYSLQLRVRVEPAEYGLARAHSCFRKSHPYLTLRYPGDAESHFDEIRRALRQYSNSSRPHAFGATFSGPWVENVWIQNCSDRWSNRTQGDTLRQYFGPYIPILLPWTDLWVNSGGHLPPGLPGVLYRVLRKDVPYITVVQHDLGISAHLGQPSSATTLDHNRIPNVLVLSAGGFGNVPIPLFKQTEVSRRCR